ncbi:GNAT family N-acetyltransferase [Methylobacterium sp. Leaf456]|uniref:GNAT family N-acetyltransferase n=1 Tax=Methylobacterium sp. Leaf456 TaxID=1736382 RepID=UPI00256FDDFF|nr:GNAT family N-acetyltransferase [Methylobacterium sp. Leaf456]
MTGPVSSAQWQPLLAEDMARVDAIAALVHAGLPERQAVLAQKRDLAPATCLKLVLAETIVGYGLAHPWMLGDVPPLDAFLTTLPPSPDCLYVHDVAILPQVRGRQAAARYVAILAAQARTLGIAHLACVSVYGTVGLWSALGFEAQDDPGLRAKLSSYGDSARYMTARI